ncbi:unnamed protein product [Trifolium pratense]|uniref:Uncharacterized protein n=1 Tax=Trifolium pratense TaxID=57577 RepID=A0ACB0J085_TRIPR|nr:unnamed protein product [Trifolium pratense]
MDEQLAKILQFFISRVKEFIVPSEKLCFTSFRMMSKRAEFMHLKTWMWLPMVFYNPISDDATSLRTRMLDNLGTPSPVALTQINAQPRADPLQEFLYSTHGNTIQGLLNCEEARVMDDTDSATLVIFNRDAAMLFNRSCAEVLRNRDMVFRYYNKVNLELYWTDEYFGGI